MSKENIKRNFKMVCKKVEKRSAEILTGLGIAGMCTAVVVGIKVTPKALQLIEEEKKEKKVEELKPVEVVKVTWKQYLPVALLTGASAACLIGANSVHSRRHAALYSAYKISETAYSELKDKTKEVVSEKKVKEIKQKIAEDKVKDIASDEKKTQIIVNGDTDTWFIDAMSNQPFKSSKNDLDAAVNRLNKAMMSEMYISLSQFYDEIGVPHTGVSDDIGWRIDKDDIEIDLSEATVIDGKAYIVVDFMARPTYGFDNLC